METGVIFISALAVLLVAVMISFIWQKNMERKKKELEELDKVPSEPVVEQPVDPENYVDPRYSMGRTVGGDCGQHGN